MAFLISRKVINNLLTSSRSSSLCLPSLSSPTISKPSAYFYLLHVSSSSTPSHPTRKPQILDPNFIRLAPFSTFRPSKPTFSPANDDRETPYSGQIPNSIHSSLLENELRDSLRKSIENIRGLKNALTVLGLVHTVPLFLASRMKRSLQIIGYLNMKTNDGLFLISKVAWLATWRVFVMAVSLLQVQVGICYYMPEDLLMIPRIKISTITMTLLPALCGFQLYRMTSACYKLSSWHLERKVDGMLQSSNLMERREVLKVMNVCLLRWKNASYLAAGLSCSWLLYVYLHSYGILTFYAFE
ncbi:uncharacterized protein LOC114727527 isoform X1 [Neltuma alba]|uniref:uncharacterized protein LOC114727527 isoform X1 n=1 Tax=Neltuma alba TaxID=207710 RepID=UPI0010A3C4F5|nr:uncharacterized protein LOC114727527 isoform X1 [Prosopis alba]